MKIIRHSSIVLLFALFLVACAGTTAQPEATTSEQPTSLPADMTTQEPMDDLSVQDRPDTEISDPTEDEFNEKQDDESMSKPGDDLQEAPPMTEASKTIPPLLSLPLTSVNSGETFTLSDFNGKVVLVETMAMWCSNCFRQQNEVKALHDLVADREDFISVGVDIDLNEIAADLKGYTTSNGFDWKYGVATKEFAREISQSLGDQFLNPPSTPMFIVDRNGEIHPLRFGIKNSQELLETLQPFLDEGM